MAFLIRAWHQRISKAAYSEFMEIYTGCSLVHVAGRDCKDSKFKDFLDSVRLLHTRLFIYTYGYLMWALSYIQLRLSFIGISDLLLFA